MAKSEENNNEVDAYFYMARCILEIVYHNEENITTMYESNQVD